MELLLFLCNLLPFLFVAFIIYILIDYKKKKEKSNEEKAIKISRIPDKARQLFVSVSTCENCKSKKIALIRDWASSHEALFGVKDLNGKAKKASYFIQSEIHHQFVCLECHRKLGGYRWSCSAQIPSLNKLPKGSTAYITLDDFINDITMIAEKSDDISYLLAKNNQPW